MFCLCFGVVVETHNLIKEITSSEALLASCRSARILIKAFISLLLEVVREVVK
jgi:hypothetical protein